MNITNKVTQIMIFSGLLWLAIPALGWAGHWYPALFLSILLMALYLLVGTARKGRVHVKMLCIILGFIASWSAAFILANYHAHMFYGVAPGFTLLGFHPSFFWILLFYWIGGVSCLAFGYYAWADAWLSRADWNEFLVSIEKIDREAN